jgi:cell wall-associated NlpC family hydrolase
MNYADLIGIPYKAHGRDENGLDCFGLILIISKRLGKPMPDVWYERGDPALVSLARRMGVHAIESRMPGCIIEMNYSHRLHLGYAVDRESMIHATFHGVCIDPIGIYNIRGFYAFD